MELLPRPPGGGGGHGDADGGRWHSRWWHSWRRRLGSRAVAAVLAAAGGGSWVRRLAATLLAAAMRGRRCCGGEAALSSRLTCARDSTGSLPARPAHSNASAAPADCWMATVAKVGEVRAAPWQRWPGGPSRCATATALRSRALPCCRLHEGHLSRLSIGKTLAAGQELRLLSIEEMHPMSIITAGHLY